MNRRLSLLFVLFSLTLAAHRTHAAAPVLETGEIAGAKFTLAHPADLSAWNHRVLLIAHGYRDAKVPLVADLFPDQLATQTLLAEGWIVAKTSYRRNGLVIADGLADLDALLAHIVKTYGKPQRVLLEGESMGGLIVTLAAEREPELYAGAIAIGAALNIKEPGSSLAPSQRPKVPLLFLTNQSELDGPSAYVSAAATVIASNLRPTLFRVSRDGHVNVNQAERLVAIRALTTWLDQGRDQLSQPTSGKPVFDATVIPTPVASKVTLDADRRGFTAHVTEISAIYGNVFIDVQPADFAAAGIAPKDFFQLTVNGQNYRVLYGRDFSDVPHGDWVTFANADGFFWLSRNWANAAATAQLKLGGTVAIRRLDSKL